MVSLNGPQRLSREGKRNMPAFLFLQMFERRTLLKFQNVELVGEANVYFGGKVSSRTFFEADGQRKTLGFVLVGSYQFSTEEQEHLQILGGSLEIRLPGENDYNCYNTGMEVTIPAHVTFEIRTDTYGDYCCTYLPE